MPRINLSQYQFTLRDPYQAGHVMTAIEANVLNYHRADRIRKLITKWVTDAERESPDGILTIEALNTLYADIAQFDEQYEMFPREDAKLPAYDDALRAIAMEDVVARLGPAHTIPDLPQQFRNALLSPDNRQKARRRLVARIRSIRELGTFTGDEDDM